MSAKFKFPLLSVTTGWQEKQQTEPQTRILLPMNVTFGAMLHGVLLTQPQP